MLEAKFNSMIFNWSYQMLLAIVKFDCQNIIGLNSWFVLIKIK